MMEDGESAITHPGRLYVDYWKREGMELFELKSNRWTPHRWNGELPFFEEFGREDISSWINVEIV